MKISKQNIMAGAIIIVVVFISIFVYLQFFNSSGTQTPAKVITKVANQTYSKSINLANNSAAGQQPTITPTQPLSPTVSPQTPTVTVTPTVIPTQTETSTNQDTSTTSANLSSGKITPTEIALASQAPAVTKAELSELPVTGTITNTLIIFTTSLTMIIVAFVF